MGNVIAKNYILRLKKGYENMKGSILHGPVPFELTGCPCVSIGIPCEFKGSPDDFIGILWDGPGILGKSNCEKLYSQVEKGI